MAPAPQPAEHPVFAKLRSAAGRAGFDALVALSPDNATYTAGFQVPSQVSNRFRRTVTMLTADRGAEIVVNVEENLARERSRFADIRPYNQFTEEAADLVADFLLETGIGDGRIGIELDYLPAQDYLRLRERLPKAEFLPCRDLYFAERMLKTDEEIAVLKRVGALTDRIAGEVLREVRPGMTEKALAQLVSTRMMDGGCDGLKCQVGSGVRSGIVNCSPSAKAFEAGDVIRLEILGDMAGYRSNVTRTAVLGRPTREQTDIWTTLIGARTACEALLRPGTPVPELYRTYVEYMRGRGLEPTLKFLGHGIGQTIHEEPYITDTRTISLEPNVAMTMEPLYMIPGRMGFHVEDMYLITAGGFERVTGIVSTNDDLIEIG